MTDAGGAAPLPGFVSSGSTSNKRTASEIETKEAPPGETQANKRRRQEPSQHLPQGNESTEVAAHYNALPMKTVKDFYKSRISQLKICNNWTKVHALMHSPSPSCHNAEHANVPVHPTWRLGVGACWWPRG